MGLLIQTKKVVVFHEVFVVVLFLFFKYCISSRDGMGDMTKILIIPLRLKEKSLKNSNAGVVNLRYLVYLLKMMG